MGCVQMAVVSAVYTQSEILQKEVLPTRRLACVYASGREIGSWTVSVWRWVVRTWVVTARYIARCSQVFLVEYLDGGRAGGEKESLQHMKVRCSLAPADR
jgi:hypothetical protein